MGPNETLRRTVTAYVAVGTLHGYTGVPFSILQRHMAVTVDYYHFLISPWSYLSIGRLNALRERTGCSVRYLPIDVGGTFSEMGGTPPGKRHPSRQSWRLEELQRFSDFLAVPMNLQPAFFPADQSLASRLVLAAGDLDDGKSAGRLSDAVLTACWRDEANVADRSTLEALVTSVGLDANALVTAADTDALTERYAATTTEAHSRGVFGSPTFMVGEERFWGQDRFDFLEAAIVKAG